MGNTVKFEDSDDEDAVGELTLPTFPADLKQFAYSGTRASTRRTTQLKSPGSARSTESHTKPSPHGSSRKRKRKTKSEDVDSPRPNPVKKPKVAKRGYAGPEKYAHLPATLPDHLDSGLDVIFCGINPGCESASEGHHFAHHTNHFWKCLHKSGLAGPNLVSSTEDAALPARFSLGLTNLVERPTAEQSELLQAEMDAGVTPLLAKIMRYRPRIVCFVGILNGRTVMKQLRDLAFAPVLSTPIVKCIPPKTELCPAAILPGISITPQLANRRSPRLASQPSLTSKPPPAPPLTPASSTKASPATLSEKKPTLNSIRPGPQVYKLIYTDYAPDDPASPQETLFHIVPSTSARVTQYQVSEKAEFFIGLKRLLDDIKNAENVKLGVLEEAKARSANVTPLVETQDLKLESVKSEVDVLQGQLYL